MQIDATIEFVLLLVKIHGVPPLGEELLEIVVTSIWHLHLKEGHN